MGARVRRVCSFCDSFYPNYIEGEYCSSSCREKGKYSSKTCVGRFWNIVCDAPLPPEKWGKELQCESCKEAVRVEAVEEARLDEEYLREFGTARPHPAFA